jgi:arylsulfatase A-like enzyme
MSRRTELPRRRASRRRPSGGFLWLCLAAVLGCAGDRPNVLLISIDTLRADHLGCYGARRATPAIDALAARGVRFANAFSPSSWTLPAHASMLSGRYPGSIRDDPNSLDLFRATTLLSSMLHDAGYVTAAVTGGRFVGRDFGLALDFDHFEEAPRGGAVRAQRWLREQAEPPFFLFFHTYTVHAPYLDRRYVRGAHPGRLRDIYRGGVLGPRHRAVCCAGLDATPAERDFLLRLYDGGVARADAEVATLLDTLEDLSLSDDTLVILTSDHGEEFWEHTGRAAYHGHTLYDELLHVPLIWLDPAADAPGRVVEPAVGLIDIVPSLLARLGVAAPDGLDGLDVSPLLANGSWTTERVLLAEGTRVGPERKSVRSAEAKLIVTPRPDQQRGDGARYPVPVRAPLELYASGDVAERTNLAERRPQLAARLLAQIEERIARMPDAPGAGSLEGLDPRIRRELRALGYLE